VLGDVPLAADRHGPVEVLVRPEQLALESPGSNGSGGSADVELVEFYGHDAVVILRLEGGAVLKARVVHTATRRGDHVGVRYDGPPAVAYPLGASEARPVPTTVG
jgi:iron(III) transport system ATP-binding protein